MTDGVDLTLVIRKKEGQLTVSALPRSNSLKDEAQNHLIPLVLTGTPAELDGGFLPTIGHPMQRAAGMISNMAQFEQQATKAAANSKANKEQKDKESKETKEKREKYDKHLKRAEELITAQNYPEALTALAQARLYAAEQAIKTVDEKITEVKATMTQGSLFDVPTTLAPASAAAQPQPTPQMSQQQPAYEPPQPIYGQQVMQGQPVQQAEPQFQQPQQPMPCYQQMPQQPTAPQYADLHDAQSGAPHETYFGSDSQPCDDDEYAEYPDFPANMRPITSHVQSQIF